MKTKRLIQIVVSYSERDGIGTIVTGIHQVAQNKGIHSHIVSLVGNPETSDPYLKKLEAFVENSYKINSTFETKFVYHFGVSNELLEKFILSRIPDDKCFYYHNVTPADFFAVWDPPLARHLLKTRSNMKKIFNNHWKITGDSQFNISELADLTNDKKLPPTIPEQIRLELHDEKNFEKNAIRANYQTINLLFVGRFVPNKRQDILIYLLYNLRKNNFPAQLSLVGKGGGPYKVFLKLLVLILGLKKIVNFKEDLSQTELELVYKKTSYLVVSSEHEGFCLPIFESLNRGIIPIARPITAMSELLFGTPVLAKNDTIDSFVDKVIEVIHLTWRQPKNYVEILTLSHDQVKNNFKSYMTADQFLDEIYKDSFNHFQSPNKHSASITSSKRNKTSNSILMTKTIIQFFAYLNRQTSLLYVFVIPYYIFLVIRKLLKLITTKQSPHI